MSADQTPGCPTEQEWALDLAEELACAWSDYRKEYGVSGNPVKRRREHKAFKAGWDAARHGNDAGVPAMSAEQAPGAPTEQEWVEALSKSSMTPYEDGKGGWLFRSATPEEQAAHLRPLIAREREAARAEGVAAVAGPVLALAESFDGTVGFRGAATALRAAIPADATEALARLKAEASAEERERIAEAIEAEAALRPGCPNYTADYRDGLRGAARIARKESPR